MYSIKLSICAIRKHNVRGNRGTGHRLYFKTYLRRFKHFSSAPIPTPFQKKNFRRFGSEGALQIELASWCCPPRA